MKILFVSATKQEIQLTLDFLHQNGTLVSDNAYSYKNISIEILITGIGIMNTCFHLGKLYNNHTYDIAINVGIAGAFDHAIGLGSVVQINQDRFSDLGCENADGSFSDIFEMGLIPDNQAPFENGKLLCNGSIPESGSLKIANGITVNKVTGSKKSIDEMIQKYNPDVESMEGAAFIFSCIQLDIPCVQIRSVSNYVEERNKDNWEIDLAIASLNKYVISIINDFHTI